MKLKFLNALSLAVIVAMLFTSVGLADNVVYDVNATVNFTSLIAGGTTTKVDLYIDPQGDDGKNGCNLTGSTILKVDVVSSDTSIATVSPSEITFTNCENVGTNLATAVTVTPLSEGSATISLALDTNTTAGSFNLAPATFTAIVTAPPPSDTTPPSVTPNVSGTLGNNGWYVSDVNVSWTVSDPESTITSSSGCGPSSVTSDTVGVTFTCSATSAGGTNSQSVTIKRDVTAPSISGSASPAPNGAGWNNTNVVVDFTCSDATSGLASCGPDQTLSNNGADQSASGDAVDNAGNSASAAVSNIDIDKELPTISSSVPAANGNGWYSGPVTASFSCSDGYSGVASCEPDYMFSGEGSGLTYTGHAQDYADNANSTDVTVNIDASAPVITFVSRTPANSNGWNNGDVTVEWSCADSGSGVVAETITRTVSTEGANQSVSATCEDLAGNTSSDTLSGINIDKTAPTANTSASPDANSNGWNNTDVTVTFSGTDGLSGIDFCDGPEVLSSEGADQSASGTCTDKAGNVSAPATASGINIDKTAPTANANASPAANSNGWNNTDVTVSFSGSDGLSGNDFCDAPVVLSSEGADQTASGTCTDKAGNVSTPASASVSIDKTAPTVSLVGGPVDGGTYYFGFVPAAPTCLASDALSGVDGSCSVSGYYNTIGDHTVTASVSDKAGNPSSASATYNVLAWSFGGFYQPVDMDKVNTVKGGSTVPLKFEVFAGSTELTDTSIVSTLVKQVTCNAGSEDTIEVVATGGTSLRYDWASGQFIYNWQTPKLPGKCYTVTLTTLDGSQLSALFKLK